MAEEDADHWLTLAREARARAGALGDPFSKRTMLIIAQRYELLAERAGRVAKKPTPDKSA